jgi:hypothetical protein
VLNTDHIIISNQAPVHPKAVVQGRITGLHCQPHRPIYGWQDPALSTRKARPPEMQQCHALLSRAASTRGSPTLRCREWAPKLAPSPLSMRVASREGGRRPSRRLNDASHSGAQRGMRRARWPASRRKETSSFTISILLPTLLYFIPSVIAEGTLPRRRDPSSQLQPLV